MFLQDIFSKRPGVDWHTLAGGEDPTNDAAQWVRCGRAVADAFWARMKPALTCFMPVASNGAVLSQLELETSSRGGSGLLALANPSPSPPVSGLGIEIWAKRDDIASGLAFGGNKIRKLEWLAADAVGKAATHWSRWQHPVEPHATGRRCCRRACSYLPLGAEDGPAGMTPFTTRSAIFCCRALWVPKRCSRAGTQGYSTAVKETWERALAQVRRRRGANLMPFLLAHQIIRLVSCPANID